MTTCTRNLVVFTALLALGIWNCPVAAAGDLPLETRVKAAFIFNFVQFTTWPDKAFDNTKDPITIGILANDQLSEAIQEAVKGKTVGGRTLVVKNIAGGEVPGVCHVLVIGDLEGEALRQILAKAAGRSILTICGADDFVDRGGMIRLFMEDRKGRFDINASAAARVHLQISSKLLKLAKSVKGDETGP